MRTPFAPLPRTCAGTAVPSGPLTLTSLASPGISASTTSARLIESGLKSTSACPSPRVSSVEATTSTESHSTAWNWFAASTSSFQAYSYPFASAVPEMMSCICEPSTSVQASSSRCAGYTREPSQLASTALLSASFARNSFFLFQRFIAACEVAEPAVCSVSCSSPVYCGSFARCSGVIESKSSFAGPAWTLTGPSVARLSSSRRTEASLGAPPTSPVP